MLDTSPILRLRRWEYLSPRNKKGGRHCRTAAIVVGSIAS
jgi:hypothetical protein